MRRPIPLLILLLATAACGEANRRDVPQPSNQMGFQAAESSNDVAMDASAPAARMAAEPAGGRAGPNVAPTAAPGVAFNYRYAFRLAAPRISEVQEQHAAMCEALGVARCRITGMLYRVVNDRDIEAMLALKVEPGAARAFGREGVAAVVRAEGMLTESEISGIDVGTGIRAAGRGIAELTAELERIEARLRAAGTRAGDRPELEYQAQQLREQIRALRGSRDAQQESLATTPMVFHYGSGDLAPGFGPEPSLGQAAQRAGESFIAGATILLIILVTLLPWAATLLIFWLIFHFARRRWFPSWPGGKTQAEA